MLLDAIRQSSFLTHYSGIVRGVIEARDFVFFASLIGLFLYANSAVLALKKAD